MQVLQINNVRSTLISQVTFLVVLLFIPLAVSAANDIVVTYKNGVCSAIVDDAEYRCSIGRNGVSSDKKEGDGTTPVGRFPLRQVFYRPDKIAKDKLENLSLPVQALRTADGWGDESMDKDYNKLVDLTHFDLKISHEKLWREDDLYNLIIVVGYNDSPVVPYKGSAIFIHVARTGYEPTAGCVGFSQEDLLKILTKLDNKSNLIVQG